MERLRLAAIEAFSKRGYEGVGLRDIAHDAGVTVGTLGYYFSSKEELYRECVHVLATDYLAAARGLLQHGASARAVFEHYIDYAWANRRLIRIWLDLQGERAPSLRLYSDREVMTPVWQLLRQALQREGMDSDEGRLRSLTFIGAVVLGAVLEDEQVSSLLGPADDSRTRWRQMIMGLVPV